MKILFYVPNVVLDAYGGESVHSRELALNLKRLGHDVKLICRLRQKRFKSPVIIKKVISLDVSVLSYILATIHGIFLALATSHKYDLIYTRSGYSASARFLSALIKLPYVTEINGFLPDEIKIRSTNSVHGALLRFLFYLEIKAYKHSHYLIAVTPQIKETLIRDYGIDRDKIAAIPNGANTDLFQPLNTAHARNELGIHNKQRLVIFIGQLFVWQGIEYLIQSAPLVVRACHDTKFLVVGDGPMKVELIARARHSGMSDRIIFQSKVPYDKVPVYINASDVCVAPFTKVRNEQCGLSPLKIYEYMACSKPIVSSRIANLEFVEESGAGVLVEPENPKELGDAVIKLLKDEKLRWQMGVNGRKYVVENHSWESIARKVAEVCELSLQRFF